MGQSLEQILAETEKQVPGLKTDLDAQGVDHGEHVFMGVITARSVGGF